MKEAEFVSRFRTVAESVLTGGLKLRVKANLLYEVPLDNRLQLEVTPTHPVRGQYAFQTDLAIFEPRSGGIELPRVVFEVKRDISTHDVITYSAKALRHKRVYPYLRYGFLIYGREMIPGKFFTHNEALDFFAAVGGLQRDGLRDFFRKLVTSEVRTSRRLERIFFEKASGRLFRTEAAISG